MKCRLHVDRQCSGNSRRQQCSGAQVAIPVPVTRYSNTGRYPLDGLLGAMTVVDIGKIRAMAAEIYRRAHAPRMDVGVIGLRAFNQDVI